MKPPAGTLIKPGHPDVNGLITDYLLNAGTGPNIYDYSPKKDWDSRSHGIITGDIWQAGPNGWALNCNDTGYATIPDLTPFENLTTGTISVNALVVSNGQGTEPLWAISRFADAIKVELVFYFDYFTSSVRAFLFENNILRWQVVTDNGTLTSFEGQVIRTSLVQDGVEPKIFINGIEFNTSFVVSTDKTKWMVNVLVADTGPAADRMSIGAMFRNGATHRIFNSIIDHVSIYATPFSASGALQRHLNPFARYRRPSRQRVFFIPTAPPQPSAGVLGLKAFSPALPPFIFRQKRKLNFDSETPNVIFRTRR